MHFLLMMVLLALILMVVLRKQSHSSSASSLSDELERLESLKLRGSLSSEEFTEAKKKLLRTEHQVKSTRPSSAP